MASGKSMITTPIISKLYCSPFDVVLVIRRRPKVANGGGFVASDCGQGVVFRVDGCGVLGKKEEMILRDGAEGNALLLIRRNGSMVEALALTRRQWKGISCESQKLVFSLKEPKNACFSSSRMSIECHGRSFEVRGDFPSRCCSIVDSRGEVVAQIGVNCKKEMERGNDVYGVEIKGGMDQAFVCGVIAVLDYIHDGSTRC